MPTLHAPANNDAALRAVLIAKENTRRHLRELPFEEKIRRVVLIQRRAAEIMALRGRRRTVWQFPV